MKLTEALSQLFLPQTYSLYIAIYQNKKGDRKARIEIRNGNITTRDIKPLLLDVLPEAIYDWSVRNNTLFAIVTNCDYKYRITTRITNA